MDPTIIIVLDNRIIIIIMGISNWMHVHRLQQIHSSLNLITTVIIITMISSGQVVSLDRRSLSKYSLKVQLTAITNKRWKKK